MSKVIKGSVPLIRFRNGTTALRTLAMGEKFYPNRLVNSATDTLLGYMVHIDSIAQWLKHNKTQVNVSAQTARSFYESVGKNVSNAHLPDISIVTFGKKKQAPASALGVINHQFWDSVADNFHNLPPWQTIQVPNHVRTERHCDQPATTFTRNGKSLQAESTHLEQHVIGGGMVFRRSDAQIAAVQPSQALQLKEALYFGRGDIITQVSHQNYKDNNGAITKSVLEDGRFVRVERERLQQGAERHPFTLIPGWAAEFFDIDEDRHITGITPAREIHYCFECDADIATDFNNATKIRLKLDSDYQWQFVRRAFEHANTNKHAVQIESANLIMIEDDGCETDLRKTMGYSFADRLRIRFTLCLDGTTKNLCVGFTQQHGIGYLAANQSSRTEIHRDKSGLSFTLAPIR